MYRLKLETGQTAKIKLKNGIQIELEGGKHIKESLLKQLHEEGFPLVELVEEAEAPKKEAQPKKSKFQKRLKELKESQENETKEK